MAETAHVIRSCYSRASSDFFRSLSSRGRKRDLTQRSFGRWGNLHSEIGHLSVSFRLKGPPTWPILSPSSHTPSLCPGQMDPGRYSESCHPTYDGGYSQQPQPTNFSFEAQQFSPHQYQTSLAPCHTPAGHSLHILPGRYTNPYDPLVIPPVHDPFEAIFRRYGYSSGVST